jgi:beta-glucosidase
MNAFPEDFLWGAATSAYQIEGSPLADGAGPSNWHRFSHTPGRVWNADTGDVACDHYRRWADDVDLMSRLGLNAYRFSLAWSRICPDGRRVNPAGIDFYSRLVDRLLERGIVPAATLHHWDMPAALEDSGAWLDRDLVSRFGDFAEIAFEALADRVPMWMTINEPWVIMDAGYLYGVHPPGLRGRREAAIASHHLLLAHAEAVRRYRGHWHGKIGLVVNLEPKDPATDKPEDHEAARHAHAYNNLYHLDPALLGCYPDELPAVFGADWPVFDAAEVASMRQPIDFVGVNYYTRKVVRHDPEAVLGYSPVDVAGAWTMATGWEVHPPSLLRTLVDVRERYGDIPIYVTENGSAFPDPDVAESEPLDDPLRVRCLREHLIQVQAARARGVDVRGYFAWSLLDNFEWSRGYSLRFGLVHVDYATQKRTMKASGLYYADVIRTRGANLSGASA